MENYVENLKEILNGKRNVNKKVYKVTYSIYRAFMNGRITYKSLEKQLDGGIN